MNYRKSMLNPFVIPVIANACKGYGLNDLNTSKKFVQKTFNIFLFFNFKYLIHLTMACFNAII